MGVSVIVSITFKQLSIIDFLLFGAVSQDTISYFQSRCKELKLRVPLFLIFGNLISEFVSDFDTRPPPEDSVFKFCLVTCANHALRAWLKAGPSGPGFIAYAEGDIPASAECVGKWEHSVLIADRLNSNIN
jgi:hypothetical protein